MTSCSAPHAGQTIISPISGISPSIGIGEPHSKHIGIVFKFNNYYYNYTEAGVKVKISMAVSTRKNIANVFMLR